VALLVATLAAGGCSKEPAGSGDEHAGHRHGPASGKSAIPDTQPSVSKPAATGAKCAAHQAAKELCFICDPALRDKSRLWCREHARYEDRCWECHPEARDANRLYCDEHGLYEDECFICHPEVKPPSTGKAASAPQAAALMCQEHGVPEAECGICHPEMTGQLQPGQGLKVRLPARDSAQGAGVQTARPSVGSVSEAIESYAELAFNQNKLAHIVAPVGGIVQEVSVDLGTQVAEKQTVVRLWSASIAEAVAKAVFSHQTLDRERILREQRVTSQKDLQQAEAEHRAACQQLRTLGFSEEQIEELGSRPEEQVLLDVPAPFAGEIVERTAVRGALVEAGKPLLTLVDRSVMWAMLNLPEASLGRVKVGQTVELSLDSHPGATFTGKLTWVGAEVDERTRMARARAEVPNLDGLLKARMFARARILTRSTEAALHLPASAIQQVEGRPIIFVKVAEDLFEARAVQLGTRWNGVAEIVAGLQPGEEVATAHVFPLKSQLLISRLGAGCAHE
jgi:cobalt-zinc-cadmium efflux system membrane fusion protein